MAREFRKLVPEHDRGLSLLLSRLHDAQGLLVTTEAFRVAVNAALAAHKEKFPNDEPCGAFPRERLVPLAAEFVLNGVGEVPPMTSTMDKFWNAHRDEIVAAVDLKQIAPVRQAGNALLDTARRLLSEAETLRDRIADMHGIVSSPPVPTWGPENF